MSTKITTVIFKQVVVAVMEKEDFLYTYGDGLTTDEQKDMFWEKYIEQMKTDGAIAEIKGEDAIVNGSEVEDKYKDWVYQFVDPDPIKESIMNAEEEEEEEDDGFEDCDCGYTHHYEDKCPSGTQTKMYEKWRNEDEK